MLLEKVTVQQKFSVATPQVKKTEIYMALQAVLCHVSSRTMEMFAQMSKVYFPDSDILNKLQLGWTKIGYLVQLDLAPYYRAQIFSLLLPEADFPPKFVSCFDEAFNRISKQKQVDVHVIFFDSNKQEVVRFFIGSHFMGHASAEDTFASLKEVHKDLDLVHNLIQVSMDGPNVNWKTVEIIDDHRKIQDQNCPNLIVIGSCGLHVVHGAYGGGQNTRWLENGAALKRAIEINQNLKVYFKDLKEKKNRH